MANWWENAASSMGHLSQFNANPTYDDWLRNTRKENENASHRFFQNIGLAPQNAPEVGNRFQKQAALPGGAELQDTFTQRGNEAWAGRPAPTIAAGPQDEFRAQQMALAKQLQDQANGVGPSQAQMQLQQATDRNLAQALALARTGGQGGGGLRQALNAQAQMSQQAAADSAILRLQEQMAARNMLAQLAGGARGQDIGLATGNAQLEAGQRGLDQAGALGFGGLAANVAGQRAGLGLQGSGLDLQTALAKYGSDAATQARLLDLIYGTGKGVAQAVVGIK